MLGSQTPGSSGGPVLREKKGIWSVSPTSLCKGESCSASSANGARLSSLERTTSPLYGRRTALGLSVSRNAGWHDLRRDPPGQAHGPSSAHLLGRPALGFGRLPAPSSLVSRVPLPPSLGPQDTQRVQGTMTACKPLSPGSSSRTTCLHAPQRPASLCRCKNQRELGRLIKHGPTLDSPTTGCYLRPGHTPRITNKCQKKIKKVWELKKKETQQKLL